VCATPVTQNGRQDETLELAVCFAIIFDRGQMDVANSTASIERAAAVRNRIPANGLFAGQNWRISPHPFPLSPALVKSLEALGRILLQFYRAANLLHRHSRTGRQPAWISKLLDQGKPEELLTVQENPVFKNEVPRVIRPDILLTDEGFAITELDSVPGGIGLTAWLNQAYAGNGDDVIGGDDRMISGFSGIFSDAKKVSLIVSKEASTYRPEMQWLADQIPGDRFTVRDEAFQNFNDGDAAYRFFELFDLENIPSSKQLFEKAILGRLRLTPPPKPLFEEKLLLALLWNRNLHEFWRQQLGDGFLKQLKAHVPMTWVVDPAPLPPHAAYPELNLTDWRQLKTLSQRDRDLILKVSGYSEQAWGARGVYLGSDLSQADWSTAVDEALENFPRSPYILQKYHKPKTVDTEWVDFENQKVVAMKGRVRLCPYYFVHGDGDQARAKLCGVLATICPADKKIIHGMTDAILAPCSIGGD
jgi:hypothetical protein